MNKTDVVTQVSERTGIAADICEKALKAFEETSGNALIGKLKGEKNNRADILSGIIEKTGLSAENAEKILAVLEEVVSGGLTDKLKFFKK